MEVWIGRGTLGNCLDQPHPAACRKRGVKFAHYVADSSAPTVVVPNCTKERARCEAAAGR